MDLFPWETLGADVVTGGDDGFGAAGGIPSGTVGADALTARAAD